MRDQVTVVLQGLAGHRHADDQIFARAQPREQSLEGGEQRNEQACSLLRAHLSHRQIESFVDAPTFDARRRRS